MNTKPVSLSCKVLVQNSSKQSLKVCLSFNTALESHSIPF